MVVLRLKVLSCWSLCALCLQHFLLIQQIQHILLSRMKNCSYPAFEDGLNIWSPGFNDSPQSMMLHVGVFGHPYVTTNIFVSVLLYDVMVLKSLVSGFGQSPSLP